MKTVLPFFLFVLAATVSFSQTTACAEDRKLYYVFLEQKSSAESIFTAFDAIALERRSRHGAPLSDWYDLSLDSTTTAELANTGAHVRYGLRWFNAVSVEASDEEIRAIGKLANVNRIEAIAGRFYTAGNSGDGDSLLFGQTRAAVRKSLELDTFAQARLSGKGVRIAVFDAGFDDADNHESFAVLQTRNAIAGMKDFYGGKSDPFYHSKHGTNVLSCIAGWYQGKPIGAAPGAEFLLARTESNFFEKLIEEDHWLAAMEWAEANGADIISSSLGYTKPRYEYADMDGNTTMVTMAAQIATRKGVLVVNAAGNDGDRKFKYISAPADADSVLTVGASFPLLKARMPFSSVGPNYSGDLKPNVVAPGSVLAAKAGGDFEIVNGTSFAAPLIAGFAACLMEKYPEETNMEILERIERSAHLYPFFDYAMGYGVPDARRALGRMDSSEASFQVLMRNDSIVFQFTDTVTATDSVAAAKGRFLHWNFSGPDGVLTGYGMEYVPAGATAWAVSAGFPGHSVFRIWFEGTIWESEGGFSGIRPKGY